MRRSTGIDALEDASGRVTVVFSRLMPPWMDTRLVLRQEGRSVIVTLPRWYRKHALMALELAGIETEIQRGWLFTGTHPPG